MTLTQTNTQTHHKIQQRDPSREALGGEMGSDARVFSWNFEFTAIFLA